MTSKTPTLPKTKLKMAAQIAPTLAMLLQLEPIARLSPTRLRELMSLCVIEDISKDLDALRMHKGQLELTYLIEGKLGLRYQDGSKEVLQAGTHDAKLPIGSQKNVPLKYTKALSGVKVIRFDADLLDIMMTWDQLANYQLHDHHLQDPSQPLSLQKNQSQWMTDAKSFSAINLQNGVFSQLPAAHINELFNRMAGVAVKAGKVLIRQGTDGDFYYIIQSGKAQVTRLEDDQEIVLAELGEQDAFGEEALASDNKRNATVTMLTDGVVLRLNKTDFIDLLKAPIVKTVDLPTAQDKVANGAMWLDVRYASEFKYDHQKGALNLPLNELRNLAINVDNALEYVVYCQTGRRSAAAAFLLAQFGIKAVVLMGGTKST